MIWPAQWHRLTDSPESLAKWAIVPAAVGLVMAIPIATWWLVGDQSTVPASADPDYAFQPLDIGLGAEHAAGIGSTVLAVVTLMTLVWAARRHHLDIRWWSVLVPLLAAGSIVGSGWRVLTAGVIGANIGAGLVIIFGGPVVAALLIWALARSIHLLHRRA
jgi:hypothetical protein